MTFADWGHPEWDTPPQPPTPRAELMARLRAKRKRGRKQKKTPACYGGCRCGPCADALAKVRGVNPDRRGTG